MIRYRVNRMFFDKPAVIAALDEGARKALSKAGAYIRTTARRSMRPPRKRPKRSVEAKLAAGRPFETLSAEDKRIFYGSSQPGEPPNVHEGTLKRLLFFGYDTNTRSVVVGPHIHHGKAGSAPSTLEHGGAATVIRRRGGKRKRKRVRVEARPYMGPALEKNLDVIPDQFDGILKGG
ncbi:MAG: hypothetical protein ACIAQF_09215 [Phycisphaerales bacterium JB065]